jgi:hypothetical protein
MDVQANSKKPFAPRALKGSPIPALSGGQKILSWIDGGFQERFKQKFISKIIKKFQKFTKKIIISRTCKLFFRGREGGC